MVNIQREVIGAVMCNMTSCVMEDSCNVKCLIEAVSLVMEEEEEEEDDRSKIVPL